MDVVVVPCFIGLNVCGCRAGGLSLYEPVATCQEQDKEGMSPAALFHAGLRGDDERNIAYENLGTLKLYPGIQVASKLGDDKYN